jgi:hypothetical protein
MTYSYLMYLLLTLRKLVFGMVRLRDGIMKRMPRNFAKYTSLTRDRYGLLFEDFKWLFQSHRNVPFVAQQLEKLYKLANAIWIKNFDQSLVSTNYDSGGWSLMRFSGTLSLRNPSISYFCACSLSQDVQVILYQMYIGRLRYNLSHGHIPSVRSGKRHEGYVVEKAH